jgi:hypothetical protein
MHLHEAMKFIEHKPDLAESIRLCESVEDVYPLTARLQAWVRTDWGAVFLDKVCFPPTVNITALTDDVFR